VVTLATVGYGDLSPQAVFGKAFTILYIFVGLGLFVAIIHQVADGLLQDSRERRQRRKQKGSKK
jgi:voltage-gated potassium channel Kch